MTLTEKSVTNGSDRWWINRNLSSIHIFLLIFFILKIYKYFSLSDNDAFMKISLFHNDFWQFWKVQSKNPEDAKYLTKKKKKWNYLKSWCIILRTAFFKLEWYLHFNKALVTFSHKVLTRISLMNVKIKNKAWLSITIVSVIQNIY